MKKVVKLTEKDLTRIVNRVISENKKIIKKIYKKWKISLILKL